MKVKKRSTALLLVVIALVLATAACQLGTAPELPLVLPSQAPEVSPQPGTVQSENQNGLEELYQHVSPGVVALKVTTGDGGGLGSGFVYDTDGHVVTNFHVVDGATQVEVDFLSGYKAFGDVVGKDPDSDLAVVKVDAPASELHPLTVGDSDGLQVGEVVAAIGNPFGLYSSMTTGIVSALGRTSQSLRPQDSTTQGRYSMGAVIQTDAAINPGNSGGPLFNLDGEIIGLNRAIETTSVNATGDPLNSGVGFAIASNVLKRVVPELISTGKYIYPYLGLSFIDDLPLEAIQALGLQSNTGAYVTTVVPDGPADQAGILAGTEPSGIQGFDVSKGGDLVIAADGKPIKTFDELISYLITQKSPGDTVTLTVMRGAEQLDIPVILGERP
jgi:2-alkenal reductase